MTLTSSLTVPTLKRVVLSQTEILNSFSFSFILFFISFLFCSFLLGSFSLNYDISFFHLRFLLILFISSYLSYPTIFSLFLIYICSLLIFHPSFLYVNDLLFSYSLYSFVYFSALFLSFTSLRFFLRFSLSPFLFCFFFLCFFYFFCSCQ